MVEAGTGAIFFPFRPLVDTDGLPVIDADTEIVVHVAAREGDSMLVRQSHAAYFLQPVIVAAEVLRSAGSYLLLAEFLCGQHLQVLHHHIGGSHHFIGSVERTVPGAFLGIDEHDTIAASCSVYRGSGSVLQDVDGFNVAWVHVGQVASRYSVNDNKWSETCIPGGNTANLYACLAVRISGSGVLDGNAGNLALNHHGRVRSGCGKELLA